MGKMELDVNGRRLRFVAVNCTGLIVIRQPRTIPPYLGLGHSRLRAAQTAKLTEKVVGRLKEQAGKHGGAYN